MHKSKLLIRRFIDLSTGHITAGDNARLMYMCGKEDPPDWQEWSEEMQKMLDDGCGLAVEHKDQGYIVWDRSPCLWLEDGELKQVGKPEPYGVIDEHDRRCIWLRAGFSLAFVELMVLATENNAGLWFDADAPLAIDLPCFDWMAEEKRGTPVRGTGAKRETD